MGHDSFSTLLFADPSPYEGAARLLDLGGTFDDYNYSETSEEADRAGIASDWYAVGADLWRTMMRLNAKGRGGHGEGEAQGQRVG